MGHTARAAGGRQFHHRARTRSADGQIFGALLLAFGTGWLLRESGLINLAWESLLASVLIVLGIGMVITARSRTTPAAMIPGIALVIMLASTSSINASDFRGMSDHTVQPSSAAELDDTYFRPFGDVVFDLSEIEDFPEGTTELKFEVVAGEMDVILPDGLPVLVDVYVGAGDLDLFEVQRDGGDIKETYKDPSYDSAPTRLRIELENGVGGISVRWASEAAFRGPSRPLAPDPPEEPVGAR